MIKIRKEKIYPCTQCDKKFTEQKNLDRHLNGACKGIKSCNTSISSLRDVGDEIKEFKKLNELNDKVNNLTELLSKLISIQINTTNASINNTNAITNAATNNAATINGATINAPSINAATINAPSINAATINAPLINTNNTTNTTNVVNINVSPTDKLDYIDYFTKKLGSKKLALEQITKYIYMDLNGVIALFRDIYLQGPKESWPIFCTDKKKYNFIIKKKDTLEEDLGGLKIIKMCQENIVNAYLTTLNCNIFKSLDTKNEEERDNILLGICDHKKTQTLCHAIYNKKPEFFLKKLVESF